jgi:hypothetical protein
MGRLRKLLGGIIVSRDGPLSSPPLQKLIQILALESEASPAGLRDRDDPFARPPLDHLPAHAEGVA